MDEGIRINKYLSQSGVCSRREADRQLEAGNVQIGERIAGLGDRVFPGEKVLFMGRPVEAEEEQLLLVLNKPKGIVCTAQKREKNNVIDFLDYPKRLFPVGRLDKDSEGLLLMTNQGELVNKIMRAGNWHEKEYQVTVDRPVTKEFIRGMAGGVPILDTVTRRCMVCKTSYNGFRIILTQGLNRQIRRMCEYFGYEVVSLKRTRIMNIRLGNLQSGQYRPVTAKEWAELDRLLVSSSSEPLLY